MAPKKSKAEKKVDYNKKLCSLLDSFSQVLIAAADNVGSNQLQSIRAGLRDHSIVLMGKKTLIRRCIKFHAEKTGNSAYLNLPPLLVGNVGLIFTKGDLKEVSEKVAEYKDLMLSCPSLCCLPLERWHHDCHPPVIHRDVKSNNILLDGSFEMRIADFGLAKMLVKKDETVSVVAPFLRLHWSRVWIHIEGG